MSKPLEDADTGREHVTDDAEECWCGPEVIQVASVIPEAALSAAARAMFAQSYDASEWDLAIVQTKESYVRAALTAIEAAAPHMLAEAQAVAWDRAVGSMVYDDGTPVELEVNTNPYRTAK